MRMRAQVVRAAVSARADAVETKQTRTEAEQESRRRRRRRRRRAEADPRVRRLVKLSWPGVSMMSSPAARRKPSAQLRT
eukprot:3844767-Rhodomonas_salina.1